MGDYEATTTVNVSKQVLFDYLSDVANLPKYFNRMTEAQPAEGDAVEVTAEVGERRVHGEAWFRVDADHQKLSWGSEGPDDYHGTLSVDGDGDGDGHGSSVTVTLTTERKEGGQIQRGLEETVANIKRLVEAG